ncbi:MAG: hypothetical protein R3183_08820 [Oleiphilaceae bacterium]|nr:hypothetical protein [Oleiphilaceae bacterium]
MSDHENAAKVRAQALFECHVQHELRQFETPAFLHWFESELAAQYQSFCELPLKSLVTAKQVKAVIQRNVIENDIPGGIAEIAGEAATALFRSKSHREALLKELLSGQQFEELVDKLLELSEQRTFAIDHLVTLPVYRDLISGVLYQAIMRYIYEENIVSKHVPGVASMLKLGKRMVDKGAPKFEGAIEDNVRNYIVKNLAFLLRESREFLEHSLSDEDIKASALALWDTLENTPIGDFQEGMDTVDLSEFVVLGYEFWLRFRKSAYFKRAYGVVVDYVFHQYGSAPLGELLEDLGIGQQQLMTEVQAFAPGVLQAIKQNGQLEALIRRRLAGFYTSEEAINCLEESKPNG